MPWNCGTKEYSLDNKEIKPVNLKGNQPWILIGRTDEDEAPVFWSPDANSQLIGKVPDAGKDWEQKKASEGEMAGWHHWCNGHEPGQTLEDSEGQGGLACCNPWSPNVSNMAVELNTAQHKDKVMCLVGLDSRGKATVEIWGIIFLLFIKINTQVISVLLGGKQSQLHGQAPL